MNYIKIVSTGTSKSGKTQCWSVQTLGGDSLGEIVWFSAWRKYTFFPDAGTTFDANCLRDIATNLEAETCRQKHREALVSSEPKLKPNCI